MNVLLFGNLCPSSIFENMRIEVINYSLVEIPAGPFTMGTYPTGLRKTDPEEPQRSVTLDAYAIGIYHVTNSQYAKFVNDAGYQKSIFWEDERFNGEACPVVGVSWYDVQNYIVWLNELTGEKYRLPTEAEWEKAARGTDGREYPWGNTWDATMANTAEAQLKKTVAVGNYPDGISPFGCYDMAGNAYDWCSDWFHIDTYKYSPSENPMGAVEGRRKVIRGGSWQPRGEFAARCANRAASEPVRASHNIGFRIALDL